MASDDEKSTPDYLTLGLIGLLLVVFAVGQWIVVQTVDTRIETLEANTLGAVGRCATRFDVEMQLRARSAAHGAQLAAAPAADPVASAVPAPSAAPSAAPAASAAGSAAPAASAAPKK